MTPSARKPNHSDGPYKNTKTPPVISRSRQGRCLLASASLRSRSFRGAWEADLPLLSLVPGSWKWFMDYDGLFSKNQGTGFMMVNWCKLWLIGFAFEWFVFMTFFFLALLIRKVLLRIMLFIFCLGFLGKSWMILLADFLTFRNVEGVFELCFHSKL